MLACPVLALAAAVAPQGLSGAAAIDQACLDAGTDAVVLNVAAHPDDESARTMVYLRRRHGMRTVTLYTTCGEGGQNAIGRDIGKALARRRVLETLAAAAHTGTEVHWLGFEDFGFSKTLGETLQRWGEQELVEAMLAELRETRPDVVFTNHGLGRGHGHHRASRWAIDVALERWCREIGRDVPLYERTFGADAGAELVFDPSLLDPTTGETYARQAHRGWLEHASQGPWGPHDPFTVRLERWLPRRPARFDPVSGHGVRSMFDCASVLDACGESDLAVRLAQTLRGLAVDQPRADRLAAAQGALLALRDLRARLPEPSAGDWGRDRVERRIRALERIWLLGHDVSVEASLQRERLPVAAEAVLRVAVHARDPEQIAALEVSFAGQQAEPVGDGPASARRRELRFPWSEALAAAASDPVSGNVALRPEVRVEVAALPVVVHPRLHVTTAPAVELAWGRDVLLFRRGGAAGAQRTVPLALSYLGDDDVAPPLTIEAPDGLRADILPRPPELSKQHREARVLVRVTADDPDRLPARAQMVARIGADSVPLAVAAVAVTVPPALRVGLVRGPDDSLQRALSDVGVDFVELDEDRLAVADLRAFTSLVLDMRTRFHRDDLLDHRDRILEFCRGGGRVLVLYHKPGEWNVRPGRPLLAPYELEVGNDRVSEEDAEVQVLAPDHPLLTTPHRIGADDFAGWVQERGLNFPRKWGPEWTPLLRMHDRGETPLDGGLLVAPCGDGRFTYCSLALYRQWRRGHQGALRLLVNML